MPTLWAQTAEYASIAVGDNLPILVKFEFRPPVQDGAEAPQETPVGAEKLTSLVSHLRSLDPENLLKKGYSILFSEKDSSIILSTKDLEKNQKIRAKVYDGSFTAIIEEIN